MSPRGVGRRAAPVPDPQSPLGRFALDLQRLRQEAGNPSYETLSYETARLGHSFSDTSLRNAAAGKQVPTWDVTEMFVRACVAFAHANPEHAADSARGWTAKELAAQWAQRWRKLRHAPDPVERRAEPATPEGNLPAELTTFIGRERELAEAERLLGRSRLVTLVGIGGVGKTRLSLRVAARAGRACPDGTWLVELAGLRQPGMLARTVAAALGVRESNPSALADFLSGKRLVLVLDNCEHLLDECAALARSLLAAAPQLLIVATSRQPLGITGEHTMLVRPLPLPDGDDLSDAVALFVDRASAVVPGFALTPENRGVVAELCRRLDGIPLAIELAARWLRVLRPQDLLERLGDCFRLLRNGDRGGDQRHRTLRALFDWSWDLCSPTEQAVWARLSVFEGGVALDAAEAVAADEETTAEDVFDAVAGLVDKSILTTVDTSGQVRYALLETLRQYGRERLAESGDEPQVRARHRAWCARLVRSAEAEWGGAAQVMWFERLRHEHADLRGALDSWLRTGDTEAVLCATSSLAFYWIACGLLREGRDWLDRARRQHSEPGLALARGLWASAYLAAVQGDFAASLEQLSAAEGIARRFRDSRLLTDAAMVRGLAAVYRGERDEAAAFSEAALAGYRDWGDPFRVQLGLGQLGMVHAAGGDSDRAIELYEQALEIGKAHGESWLRSSVLWVLGIEHLHRGDSAAATALLRETLLLKRGFNDRLGIAAVADALAWVASAEDRAADAARLFGFAHATWRHVGERLLGFPDLVARHEHHTDRVRDSLGEDCFAKEFDEGARLSVPDGVALAAGLTRP
ncbi:LuxR family transcriptional regulator [Saccharopolyspora subtropica]|uniref:LuxR family transcriptional regulator n=1 Tax=Saccharopolyspora thermophila TaxID=89367 RepID=A0A917NHJ3_9PSEU|nr:tetratricopeptide repeat protein [Saccharopolyspora subtropica]GGJ01175.1 LuxR family transcriptional regulator [Saccharopolyspora subtropica]